MTLTDLMIKARVNLALARDPRVSSLDIGVSSDDGIVMLTGDVDSERERDAAIELARSVDGVKGVRNEITAGVGRGQETADFVSQRFLEKLEEEWNDLPEQTALAQADYMKWALWMICKFRIPDTTGQDAIAEYQAKTTEEAIQAVADRVDCPPALLALELQKIAEEAEPIFNESGPHLRHTDLVTSPMVDEGNTELAA
jgi:hypothetical protein